jgi:hypothetical protein
VDLDLKKTKANKVSASSDICSFREREALKKEQLFSKNNFG